MWKRIVMIVGIIVLVVLPLVVIALRSPVITTQLPASLRLQGKTSVSPRYSVKNAVPGYTLTLAELGDFQNLRVLLFFTSPATSQSLLLIDSTCLAVQYIAAGILKIVARIVW